MRCVVQTNGVVLPQGNVISESVIVVEGVAAGEHFFEFRMYFGLKGDLKWQT